MADENREEDGAPPSESSPDETVDQEKPQNEVEGGEAEGEKKEAPEKGDEAEEAAPEGEKAEEQEKQLPVPYERFSKVVAQKNQAIDNLEAASERIRGFEAYVEKVKPVVALAEDLYDARMFDPRIRELLQEHWLFNNRPPSDGDIDNVTAYADFLARKKATEGAAERGAPSREEKPDENIQRLVATWQEQEKKLLNDPELARIATEDRLLETYEEIRERAEKGEDVSRLSFEKVFREIFYDDVVAAERERGRKEAAARQNRPKPASMKPGRVPPPKMSHPSTLSLDEHIRRVSRGEEVLA